MTTLLKSISHLRAVFIAMMIAMMLPVASLANSSRYDDDNDRGNFRRRYSHRQLYKAMKRKHQNYRRQRRIADYRERMRHRRFLMFLRAKHLREHRRMRNDSWRWYARNRR